MNYEDLPRGKNNEVLAEKVKFPITYTMLTPIGQHLQVVMREPTVLDLKVARKQQGDDATITMLSNLLELAPDEVQKMGTRDYSRLSEVIGSFL